MGIQPRLSWARQTLQLCSDAPLDAPSRAIVSSVLSVALDRVAQQQASRELQERLTLLSSASFEGLFAHVNGHIIDANLRLAEMLGCEPAELQGDWVLRHCIAPEDVPQVVRQIAEEGDNRLLVTAIRKDGTRFPVEFQVKQCRLGELPVRVGAVRDVSERERMLTLLRESETRLRELADAVFDLTVLSRDGVILDAQGQVEQLLGHPRVQLIGRRVLDFVGPAGLDVTRRAIEQRAEGRFQSSVKSLAGQEIPVEVIAINSTLTGQPVRVTGIRDLRDTVRIERQRRDLERQLEQSQRLESLGVLAGGIAHDFNNLLVGVLGNADLLLTDTTKPDDREALECIVAAAEKAAGLTAQLLAYAGRATVMASTAINLRGLFDELGLLLAASLSKKAQIQIDVSPDLAVLADSTRLSQVLMNLLTNASDALGQDAGLIAVHARRVTEPEPWWQRALGATVGPGDWVQVDVRDSGHGMDEETLSRIFEPFFSTKSKGHGLGLAACLGIVASHGGAVHVESTLGQGSCIRLLLPAADAAPIDSSHADVACTPCRVLVVDDEPIVRLQLRRCLDRLGYQVTDAANGREGLQALRTGCFDVLILDLTMPELDGVQVVSQMRESGLLTPVVLASGYLDAESDQRLGALTIQARLRKPYRLRDLLSAIDSARGSQGDRAPESADQER